MFPERLMFGDRRRRMLEWILDHHYRSLFRRQWGGTHPHFFDHRHDAWGLLRGEEPWSLYRGFNAGMLVEPEHSVLDIGCGDGFFTSRFFGSDVDGIDIDPSAIDHARRINPGPNYFLLDAVRDPFPRSTYDVVVWDGALAHLTRDETEIVLDKIVACRPKWFCGSEGLEDHSPDHFQEFNESSLLDLLSTRFQVTEITTHTSGDFTEAFWRARPREEEGRSPGQRAAD